MREYKTVEVKYDKEELVCLTCDACGAVAKGLEWNGSEWNRDETVVKVEISRTKGDVYPEGGFLTKYDVDICPTCFKDKLIPALEELGCIINEKEIDV